MQQQPTRLHELRPIAPGGARGASLAGRALDDLGFIRATMERAVTFTRVPVWGGFAMGATAIAAAALASRADTRGQWLSIWLLAAGIAALTGFVDIALQTRRSDGLLLGGASSRFLVALVPGFVAGAVLTMVLWRAHQFTLVPGTWLLAYGVALVAAGTRAVRAVRFAGIAFMAWGTVTFLLPSLPGDTALAIGFGGIHVLLGTSASRARRG